MKRLLALASFCVLVAVLVTDRSPQTLGRAESGGTGYSLHAWNDLGMHAIDSDHSVFSLQPLFNTIEAQLVDGEGTLVTGDSGLLVTYEAVADPAGSMNRTSVAKTDFWQYVGSLYGSSASPDQGLAGHDMPGALNLPQVMTFDAAAALWRAEGVPITSFDDLGRRRFYPLMRVTAKLQSSGAVLASTDIVLPVSEELDCRACHASGANPMAEPAAGWAWQANSEHDFRRNILRLHDEKEANDPQYAAALAALGYSAAGLLDTVVTMNTPVLCVACHESNAMPGSGLPGISALTTAMHGEHATVRLPGPGTQPLKNLTDRAACYLCHPGVDAQGLRGAMGRAAAADGSFAMHCRNCHGSMTDLADSAREGWLDLPSCQNCHTGNAVVNSGQIRYTAAHLPNGNLRTAADPTFATEADVPSTGYSLFRYSTGHGGLRCSACHGSTHAEFPSRVANDDLASIDLQGHVGVKVECASCHSVSPQTRDGGPHGMHPVGQPWVGDHRPYVLNGNHLDCRNCHGTDYRGTVLSRAQADRVLQTPFGQKTFERGMMISCYECHDGPGSLDLAADQRPTAQPLTATYTGVSLSITLQGTDPEGAPLSFRIVEQPRGGTVGVSGAQATYRALPGFAGADQFRYLARDGTLDSLPVTVVIDRPASSASSRFGYEGSLGEPTLAVDQPPQIGGSFNLLLGNSWGFATQAWVIHSLEKRTQPILLGGTLWLRPDNVAQLGLGATGTAVPVTLANDPALEGLNVFVQMVQYDPGAVFGYAFSPLLTLTIGN